MKWVTKISINNQNIQTLKIEVCFKIAWPSVFFHKMRFPSYLWIKNTNVTGWLVILNWLQECSLVSSGGWGWPSDPESDVTIEHGDERVMMLDGKELSLWFVFRNKIKVDYILRWNNAGSTSICPLTWTNIAAAAANRLIYLELLCYLTPYTFTSRSACWYTVQDGWRDPVNINI